MKLEGSVNGEDMKVFDAPEVPPTMEQFKAEMGGQPAPAPAPAPTATSAPVTTYEVPEPAQAPAPAALPQGEYGSFKDVDTMYKSWREASKKISQQGEEAKRLREENERLRQQQYQAPAPAPVPQLSKEQLVQQFVDDPLGFRQQIVRDSLAPVVPVMQQMYRELQEVREKETITNPADRALYDQFRKEGIFDELRQDPSNAGLSNLQLLKIGKAEMLEHNFSQVQAQLEKVRTDKSARNARAVVESGGSPVAPAKTLEQMDEKELQALARLGWNTGERF